MLNYKCIKLYINRLSSFRSHFKYRFTREVYRTTGHLHRDRFNETNICHWARNNWLQTHSPKRINRSYSVIKLHYFASDHLGSATECLISCKDVYYEECLHLFMAILDLTRFTSAMTP